MIKMERVSKRVEIIMLLLPAFMIQTIMLVYPIFQVVYLSFFKWNGIPTSPLEYVGFNNYIQMFTDMVFWRSLYNVGVFIMSVFVINMPLAFGLAMIITSNIKGVRIFKTAFFMPVVISMTAIALMWSFIFYAQGGVLNNLLEAIGLSSLTNDWLGNPHIAIYSVVLVNSWACAGLNMIIFASGIVSIPEEIYNAADIDGAVGLARLRYVTIPMMKGTFNTYIVLSLIGSLKAFEVVFVMTRGGPNEVTNVPVTLLYKYAFRYNYFGLGNSIGTVILILAIIITILVNNVFIKTEQA
jgi:raffinose/stachyose/melibiose transport system permease protein